MGIENNVNKMFLVKIKKEYSGKSIFSFKKIFFLKEGEYEKALSIITQLPYQLPGNWVSNVNDVNT